MSGFGAIYRGTVVHRRFGPVPHEMRYGATYLLVDLERLDEAARRLWFLGRRAGLFMLRERDLGPAEPGPLVARLRGLLERHGLHEATGRIEMLCLPRMLGYVFNPLTTYYCRDAADVLRAVVYEVSNTFGERRHYVVPVERPGALRHEQGCAKTMAVSPFNDAAGAYGFTVVEPGERLRLTVTLWRGGERVLAAYIAGERRPLTDGEILKAFLARPFLTYKVIAGIHWEALKLWWKGLKLHTGPQGSAGTRVGEIGCARSIRRNGVR